ncbi:MAG: hypothetical protein KGI49_02490 [Patescibacteria group bacterium]|nr:hypothetical protein [Patescibacteria group bacterium]
MYTLITIFYVALLGIITMILLKRREVVTGHPSIVSRMGSGSDRFFHAIFAAVIKFLSYINRHTAIALAQWLAVHVLKYVRAIYVDAKHAFVSHPQGKKIMDAVRGRGEVAKHGASFYLRQIAETPRVK